MARSPDRLDLLLSLDFRMTSSTLLSDIVLPAATWYEKHDLNTTDMHPFVHAFTPAINPPPYAEYRQAILDGLRGAANDPGGTSTAVFEGFPIEIAGKTGTAEKGLGRADQSWYVALAPWPDPKYVVAVTDEAGGFGADTAAPMARLILAELFNVDENRLVAGGDAPD